MQAPNQGRGDSEREREGEGGRVCGGSDHQAAAVYVVYVVRHPALPTGNWYCGNQRFKTQSLKLSLTRTCS